MWVRFGGIFFRWDFLVIFNKATEYSLLRVFVQGSSQNAENKACRTRLIL